LAGWSWSCKLNTCTKHIHLVMCHTHAFWVGFFFNVRFWWKHVTRHKSIARMLEEKKDATKFSNECLCDFPNAWTWGRKHSRKGVVAPRGHHSMHRGQTHRSQFYWKYCSTWGQRESLYLFSDSNQNLLGRGDVYCSNNFFVMVTTIARD
jgi:hypothetical protein